MSSIIYEQFIRFAGVYIVQLDKGGEANGEKRI